jgi:hypothetical protein
MTKRIMPIGGFSKQLTHEKGLLQSSEGGETN